MTDFDFDELDKAVNTALGSADDTETRETTQAPRVEPEPAERPTQTQSAPAARRSSGRFMDVVHPSSDMRNRTASDVPGRVTPPVVPQEDVSAPIDDLDWKTPLDSPFLPDAQVEKRPLGGSAPTGESLRDTPQEDTSLMLEEPNEPRLEAPDELQLEAPDDKHIMPDPIDFATAEPVVEEVAESFAVVEEPISSDLASDADLSQAAALDAEVRTDPVVAEAPAAITSVSVEPVATELSGPVSITQQYKEKPAEATEPGAIYDTETYHQPITTPAKKKSGAWVILWILLILAVGGGAGAGFYFFVLPTL